MSANAKSIQFYLCGITLVRIDKRASLCFEWNNNTSKSCNLFWYFYRKNILKLIWLGNCTDVLNFNSDIKFTVCVGGKRSRVYNMWMWMLDYAWTNPLWKTICARAMHTLSFAYRKYAGKFETYHLLYLDEWLSIRHLYCAARQGRWSINAASHRPNKRGTYERLISDLKAYM